MDLVAGEIDDGHRGELTHGSAVAGGEGFDCLLALGALDLGSAAG